MSTNITYLLYCIHSNKISVIFVSLNVLYYVSVGQIKSKPSPSPPPPRSNLQHPNLNREAALKQPAITLDITQQHFNHER